MTSPMKPPPLDYKKCSNDNSGDGDVDAEVSVVGEELGDPSVENQAIALCGSVGVWECVCVCVCVCVMSE